MLAVGRPSQLRWGIPGVEAPNVRSMRVVLRDIKTGLYLQEIQKWTTELQQARSFRHSAEAMDFARDNGFHGLEVLLDFDEPPRQVSFPLP